MCVCGGGGRGMRGGGGAAGCRGMVSVKAYYL